MNRDQLLHVIRAAAIVTGVDDLVVLGSQAVLASVDDFELPWEVTRSVEADIAVDLQIGRVELGTSSEDLALLIDGAIGEGSHFHATFGYYGEGVEIEVAVLADGWRDRLVPLIAESPAGPKVGWCLSVPDVWVAKAAAGRQKDSEFCRALASNRIVLRGEVEALAARLQPPRRNVVTAMVERSFG